MADVNPNARDAIIDQAQQQRMTRDTLILQKVNAAHREAFVQKFPGQVEHILRLIAERLQAVLTKKPDSMSDPSTWITTAQEIESLSAAMHSVYQVHKEITNEHSA